MANFVKNEFFAFSRYHFYSTNLSYYHRSAESTLECNKKVYVRFKGTLSSYQCNIPHYHCKYFFHRARSRHDKMQLCFKFTDLGSDFKQF